MGHAPHGQGGGDELVWQVELVAQGGGKDEEQEHHGPGEIHLAKPRAVAPQQPHDERQGIEGDEVPVTVHAKEP